MPVRSFFGHTEEEVSASKSGIPADSTIAKVQFHLH